MHERQVVGVDGSGPSRTALRWALRRATADRSPVLAVHVRTGGPGDMDDAGLAAVTTEARSAFPSVPIEARVLHGDIVAALLDTARDDDLLVVGTHKTGHLHGRVFGTRALSVAVGAGCSVAVIPEGDLRFRRGVVVGLDDGPTGAIACAVAGAEAERLGDDVVLLHAAEPGSAEHADATLAAATERLRSERPGLGVERRTTTRAVAPSLLDASLGHALLVVGGHTPDDRRTGAIGSVLHDVLINLTAPVLVARAPACVTARSHDVAGRSDDLAPGSRVGDAGLHPAVRPHDVATR